MGVAAIARDLSRRVLDVVHLMGEDDEELAGHVLSRLATVVGRDSVAYTGFQSASGIDRGPPWPVAGGRLGGAVRPDRPAAARTGRSL